MRVLVACEESQVVTKAFRALGHEAFSCDLKPCSGGCPEWHLQTDAVQEAYTGGWDLMIAHPDCTYLCVTGNRWMKEEYKSRFPDRPARREAAIEFFLKLFNAPIPKVAVENPVGVMSSRFRKPDQYVQPYFFGDPHRKKTGLWLRGLPLLEKTHEVEPELTTLPNGKTMSLYHYETFALPALERSRVRSTTFPGFARAMAGQWGGVVSAEKEVGDV